MPAQDQALGPASTTLLTKYQISVQATGARKVALQVVYVLTNPAMPGFVKIGKTYLEDVGQRLAQLYTTGVPFPFELSFACKVPNADEVEKALHMAFAPYRANARREFFKIVPEQAIAILKLLHVVDSTKEISSAPTTISPEEIESGRQYKSRRPNLNFKEMGIPIGAVLRFTEGDATSIVSSERKVQFNGEEMSLTAATRQLFGLEYSIQPTPFWTFEGNLLSEIYEQTYTVE